MKVKEAICFLSDIEFPKESIISTKRINAIIRLLQRGKKFEAMWEELENNYGFLRNDHTRSNKIVYLKSTMEDIEQKYFPKEADNG